jgi:hypothetical protein
MARKKKERASRNNTVPGNPTGSSPSTQFDIQLLLPGMIAFFTGARSEEEIMEITDKCCHFGKDIYCGNFLPAENLRRFPHASYEAEEECSSR